MSTSNLHSQYPENGPAEQASCDTPDASQAVTFNSTRVKLLMIAQQRAALAAEERDVKRAYFDGTANKPVEKTAFRIIQMLDRLDPDDRADALHTVDKHAAFLRYW